MTAAPRSTRAEVRNPVLALPAARRLRDAPAPARALLAELLDDLAADARQRAEACWRKHKAPMAAYWKAVAVYAKHLARALRAGGGAGETHPTADASRPDRDR